MKALSTSIVIVVTAVVILVAALVILTIFGGGIGSVSTLTNFKTQCISQCRVTCPLGSLPPTWGIVTKVSGIGETSCDAQVDEANECGCTGTGGTTTPTTPPSAATCSTYDGNAGPCNSAGCKFCGVSGNANYRKCLTYQC